jgi:hypothetical protein
MMEPLFLPSVYAPCPRLPRHALLREEQLTSDTAENPSPKAELSGGEAQRNRLAT